MEKIDGNKLNEILEKQDNVVGQNIELSFNFEIYIHQKKKITFKDCRISGADIFFMGNLDDTDIHSSIYFINCSFYNEQISFNNCNIESLYLTNTYIKNDFNISSTKINYLSFINKCKIETIDIFGSTVNIRFSINKKNIFNRLLISNSKIKSIAVFFNSTFNDINISHSSFLKEFNFNKNTLNSNFNIDNSTFNKINFDSNTFTAIGNNYRFNLLQSTFDDITYFSNINALNYDFFIRDCTFKKFTRFNNSDFSDLHLEQTNFENISSFQDTKFNTIFIDRTNFEKVSFFDDIAISKIDKCDKRTLRNIKQQLQRANNTIDYDIFRSYEMNAHRKELLKNKKYKDTFILFISNFFSKNGMNWIRALIVTILVSLFFYSLFYWIYVNEYNFTNIEFNEIGNFFNGFTRFLIPTNIYNPLKDRVFVTGLEH